MAKGFKGKSKLNMLAEGRLVKEYLIFRCTSNQKDMNNKVICNCFGRGHRKSQPNFGYGLPGPREPI